MEREAVLADFQACTGIEDVELAIGFLDSANWSLMDAVNSAMSRSSAAVDDKAAGEAPSTSSSSQSTRTRMLEFSVRHNNDDGRMIHLKVPDHADVRTLKRLLSSEIGDAGCLPPPCQMELSGFRSLGRRIAHVSDSQRLSELALPKENVLQLSTTTLPMEVPLVNGGSETQDGQGSDFKLHICNLDDDDKVMTLNFRPFKTVLQVKLDVSTLTSVPVSRQVWTGWPEDDDDGSAINDKMLAQCGIPREHHLKLKSAPPPAATATAAAAIQERPEDEQEEGEAEEEDDEFVDASDMMMDDGGGGSVGSGVSSSTNNRLRALLPDEYGTSDDAIAAIKFSEEFANRYGRPHPEFFPGSLDEAIKQSCAKPAKERKMLAIYLHHDGSVLTNVFCAQGLCAESVVAFLGRNFVTFGWDVTHSSNRTRAVNMMTQHFGSVAASTVRNMEIERFPLIALVHRLRGTTEIFEMIHGNVTLDELMSQLLSAQETHSSKLMLEVYEEGERAARDAVKREQDLAFEMSLMADREKEAQRRCQEEEEEQRERLEAALQKSQEEEERRKGEEKLQRQQRMRKTLPRQPDPSLEGVSELRFRVPDGVSLRDSGAGQFLTRRFLASDSLQTVLDYLASEGYPSEEFKILSSWPRRDATTLDPSLTLKELNFYPQETLTLEEK